MEIKSLIADSFVFDIKNQITCPCNEWMFVEGKDGFEMRDGYHKIHDCTQLEVWQNKKGLNRIYKKK